MSAGAGAGPSGRRPVKKHYLWGWGQLAPASGGRSAAAPSPPASPSGAAGSRPTKAAAVDGGPTASGGVVHVTPKLLEALESSTAIRTVLAGTRHCLAVTHGGELYAWGSGFVATSQATASGSAAAAVAALAAPESAASSGAAATAAATASAADANNALFVRASAALPASDCKVVHVASTRQYAFAVTTSGQLYRWDLDALTGSGGALAPPTLVDVLQLGAATLATGSATSRVSRVACGAGGFVVALTLSGRCYSWGTDTHGRLGHGTVSSSSSSAAAGHARALSRPALATVPAASASAALPSVAAASRTLALDAQDAPATAATAVDASTSASASGAVDPADADAKAAAPTDAASPAAPVPAAAPSPATAQKWTTPRLIERLADKVVTAIACEDGTVYTWGCGMNGRLGLGQATTNRQQHANMCADQPTPTQIPGLGGAPTTAASSSASHAASAVAMLAASPSGASSGSSSGSSSSSSSGMISRQPIIAISCGYHHTVALDVMGKLYCWGAGDHGQLGLGTAAPPPVPAAASPAKPAAAASSASPATPAALLTSPAALSSSANGEAIVRYRPTPLMSTSGDGAPGALPSALAPADGGAFAEQHVVSVSCGAFHTAAVTAIGDVWTWGWNSYGQLGVGDRQSRYRPTLVSALTGSDVSLVSCGASYTCAVTDHLLVSDDSPHGDSGGGATASGSSSAAARVHHHMHIRKGSTGGALSSDDDDGGVYAPPESATAQAAAAAALAAAGNSNAHGNGNGNGSGGQPMMLSVDQPDDAKPNRLKKHYNPASRPVLVPSSRADGAAPASASASTGGGPARAASPTVTPVKSTSPLPVGGGHPHSPAASDAASAVAKLAPAPSKSFLQLVKDAFTPAHTTPSSLAGVSGSGVATAGSSPPPAAAAAAASGSSSGSSSSSGGSVLDKIADKLTGEDASRSELVSVGAANFRPNNLPPKSAADADKHKKEVARMSKLYREKLAREAQEKASKRREAGEKQRADEDERKRKMKRDVEREQRMEECCTAWLKKVLPEWETKKTIPSKARDLVWKTPGIPPRVRGQVWPLALGNALMINPELFAIFGAHAKAAREARLKAQAERKKAEANGGAVAASPTAAAGSGSGSKSDSFSYIDVDLTRTFPSLAFFQEECPMHEQLRGVLETYCFYRPDVGYVQGMSYLAGNFLLYMTPYQAFVCLSNLLNAPFFHVFLKLNADKMRARYALFGVVLRDSLPELYAHFAAEGVSPDLYFMEWCMTLFTKRLPLDVVGRVWDVYLIDGEETVYRVATAILRAIQPHLTNQPFDKIMKLLATKPLELSEEQLFSALDKVKLSSAAKDQLSKLQQDK